MPDKPLPSLQLVYMTAGSRSEAETIGEKLVTEKLAACVNIIDGMHAIYQWDGQLQKDSEAVMIAKTTEAMVPRLVARVKALHSYDCPCVVTMPIAQGNPAFLEWVAGEVTDPNPSLIKG